MAGTSSRIKSFRRHSISACKNRWIAGIESNVLETLTDSMGSLRNTRVSPFCLEKTRIMMPESWKDDKRRNMGTINGVSAARTPREVKEGVRRLRVFSGLAWSTSVLAGVSGVYLHFCLQDNVGVARVFQFKHSTKSVLSKFSYFQHFEVWRSCPQIKLLDDNVVCDDGRHRRF